MICGVWRALIRFDILERETHAPELNVHPTALILATFTNNSYAKFWHKKNIGSVVPSQIEIYGDRDKGYMKNLNLQNAILKTTL